MKNKAEAICDHLEFLGFTIKKFEKKEEKNPQIYAALHPKKWNIVFWEVNPDLVMFQISVDTGKKPNKEMDACVNAANQKLFITKTYHHLIEGKTSLKFEVFYVGEYAKSLFGVFLDSFLNDVKGFKAIDVKKAFF
jgi:hypothetical protein